MFLEQLMGEKNRTELICFDLGTFSFIKNLKTLSCNVSRKNAAQYRSTGT